MANFCGGIRLGDGLKIIDGVICDANAARVHRSKAVSTCGQLWDGALFTVFEVGGAGYISLHGSEGEEIGAPVIGRTGNRRNRRAICILNSDSSISRSCINSQHKAIL